MTGFYVTNPGNGARVLEMLSPDLWQRREWVFRGVGDADHFRLLPRAWRPESPSRAIVADIIGEWASEAWGIVERHPWRKVWNLLGIDPDGVDRERLFSRGAEYVGYRLGERLLLRNFALLADEVGLAVDEPDFDDFDPAAVCREWGLKPPPVFVPKAIVAIAQHYGIPTRLLDWTWNPLVALFFAIHSHKQIAPVGKPKSPLNLCVWALNIKQLEKSSLGTQIRIYRSVRHRNPYLHAQEGVFTTMPVADGHFLRHGAWPCIEEIAKFDESCQTLPDGQIKRDAMLIKINFDQTAALVLAGLLKQRGITEAHAFRTYDSVARTLTDRSDPLGLYGRGGNIHF